MSQLQHRLAAILAADAAGYSRLMSIDDQATVAALDAARAVFRAQIEAQQGRVIDMAGDSVLAVFGTATGAVTAALAIQAQVNALAEAEPRRPPHALSHRRAPGRRDREGRRHGLWRRRQHRRAAEGLAEPGGITVSDSIRSAVKGKADAASTTRASSR